jgi:hypothetical protein
MPAGVDPLDCVDALEAQRINCVRAGGDESLEFAKALVGARMLAMPRAEVVGALSHCRDSNEGGLRVRGLDAGSLLFLAEECPHVTVGMQLLERRSTFVDILRASAFGEDVTAAVAAGSAVFKGGGTTETIAAVGTMGLADANDAALGSVVLAMGA